MTLFKTESRDYCAPLMKVLDCSVATGFSLGGVMRLLYYITVTVLCLTGCAHTPRVYPPTDAFFKGPTNEGRDRFIVPKEFKNGTASLKEVHAWTASLLGSLSHWKTISADIDYDGHSELFIAQSANHGTGGNAYFVFAERPRGYQYLGHIGFGGYRVLAPDRHGRPRILTSGRMGGNECAVSVQVLMHDGFHPVAGRAVPCGDGAYGNDQIIRLLFESETLSEESLQSVFGKNL